MGSYLDDHIGDSSLIRQNQSPPLSCDNRHIVYRNEKEVVADEAATKGTIHQRTRCTGRCNGRKRMPMLQPDTGLPVDSDVKMAEVANEEEVVVNAAASSDTDVDGAYLLLLEASNCFITI